MKFCLLNWSRYDSKKLWSGSIGGFAGFDYEEQVKNKFLSEKYEDKTLIDLGKDVAPQAIVDCALEHDVKLVGLSALMTTTLASMEETIKAIKAEDPSVKVMVGGAVLTEEYASQMGADFYCSDAMKSVEAAQQVFAEMLLGMEEK